MDFIAPIKTNDGTGTPFAANSASRLKYWARVSLIFAGLIGIFTIFYVKVPFFSSAEDLRREIAKTIKGTTGLAANLRGPATFTLLPFPKIRIDMTDLSDATGALSIEGGHYTGYVRILPLLTGRLEISASILEEPKITVNLASLPMLSESALGQAAATNPGTPQASLADQMHLGGVAVVNGTGDLKYGEGERKIHLDKINLNLDWPRFGGLFNLNGTAIFAQERLDLAVWMPHPSEYLRGAKSPIDLRLTANTASLSAHGELGGAPQAQFDGTLTAMIPNLPGFIKAIGLPLPSLDDWKQLSLDSEASLSPKTMVLSDLHFKINSTEFEGALAYQSGKAKPVVSGTMATDLLDLTPFAAYLMDFDQILVKTPVFASELQNLCDLDLRISAGRLQFKQVAVMDAALSVMHEANKLEFTLAEALAYEGALKGHAHLEIDKDDHQTISLKANGSARDVNLAAFNLNSEVNTGWSGKASAILDVESSGPSIRRLLHRLHGQAEFRAVDGEWPDLFKETFAKSTMLSSSLYPRGFQAANLSLKITDGSAKVETALIETENLRFNITGAADLAEGRLDMHAFATPTKAMAGQPAPASQSRNKAAGRPLFGFAIRGPFDELSLSLDGANP